MLDIGDQPSLWQERVLLNQEFYNALLEYRKGMICDPVGKAKSVVLTDEGLAESERRHRRPRHGRTPRRCPGSDRNRGRLRLQPQPVVRPGEHANRHELGSLGR